MKHALSIPGTFRPTRRARRLQGAELVRVAHAGERSRMFRFEMLDSLLLGTGGAIRSATALRLQWLDDSYDDDDEVEITVTDYQRAFSKPATAAGDGGALGYGWFPPDRPFPDAEILWMQMPGLYWGTAKSDFTTASISVLVEVTACVGGYNLFQGNYGTEQSVLNVPRGNSPPAYNFAGYEGSKVLFHYEQAVGSAGSFRLVWVEPNNKSWSQQDVVTSIGVDGGGHVTNVTYHTATYPWWTDWPVVP